MLLTKKTIFLEIVLMNQSERSKELNQQGRTAELYNYVVGILEDSPGHDQPHIDQTLAWVGLLSSSLAQEGYQLDKGLLRVATICHDLGRVDPSLHGEESVKASVEAIKQILPKFGFEPEEIKRVGKIIEDHDSFDPTKTPEGQVIRIADYLAGFDASGILRIITWGMKSGRSLEEILAVFDDLMPRRIALLEIPFRRIAFKQWPFVNLFLKRLENPLAEAEIENYQGKYIIVDGISGSGKGTQAKQLTRYFEDQGHPTTIIHEPSEFGRELIDNYKQRKRELGEPTTQPELALLYTLDRISIASRINHLRRSGNNVIGIRSFLSTMSHQGENPLKMAEVLFLNRFAPYPDLVILLEVETEEALRRIRQRHQENSVPIGDFEKLEKLRINSQRYHQAIGMIPGLPVVRVSANEPIEEVFLSIQQVVEESGLF